jgi:hypothetical protein
MSNTASISVRQISYRHKPEDSHHDIFIEDSYANESLFCEKIPDTAKELFLYVSEWGGENSRGILDFVFEEDKDILIEGEWYSCDQLKEWLNS